MNPLHRFARFLVVGAMGMALQLAAVAAFHRLLPTHNLWTTTAALELTLLHNFTWHVHYTWRDRHASHLRQCIRFHLSNGVLSMFGNVTIVAFLLHTTHLQLMVANILAIATCSLANFCLGTVWVFSSCSSDSRGAYRETKYTLGGKNPLLLPVCEENRLCPTSKRKELIE